MKSISILLLVAFLSTTLIAQTEWELLDYYGVNAITALELSDGTILLGADTESVTGWVGVFASTNAGSSWQEHSYEATWNPVEFIESDADTIYAFSGNSDIYRSGDKGRTWNPISLPEDVTEATDLLLLGGDTIIVSHREGILVSYDGAKTWYPFDPEIVHPQGFHVTIVNLTETHAGEIYAGTESTGLFRLNLDSNRWELTGFDSSKIHDLIIAPTGEMFISVDSRGVYASTDDGYTWRQIDSDGNMGLYAANGDVLLGRSGNQFFRYTYSRGRWDPLHIPEAPQVRSVSALRSGKFIFCTRQAVYVSSDNGTTLQQSSTGLSNKFVDEVATHSGDIILRAGSNLYRSEDGGSSFVRRVLSTDSISTDPHSLLYSNTGTLYFIWGRWLFGREVDSVYRIPLDPITHTAQFTDLEKDINGKLYVLEDGGTVHVSEDNGATWSSFNIGGSDLKALAVQGDKTIALRLLETEGSVLYSTEDGGVTTVSDSIKIMDIHDIGYTPSGELLAYHTPRFGSAYAPEEGLYKRTGKDEWEKYTSGMAPNTIFAYTLQDDGDVYLYAYSDLIISSDGGGTWSTLDEPIPGLYVRSVVRTDDSTWIVGTTRGCYKVIHPSFRRFTRSLHFPIATHNRLLYKSKKGTYYPLHIVRNNETYGFRTAGKGPAFLASPNDSNYPGWYSIASSNGFVRSDSAAVPLYPYFIPKNDTLVMRGQFSHVNAWDTIRYATNFRAVDVDAFGRTLLALEYDIHSQQTTYHLTFVDRFGLMRIAYEDEEYTLESAVIDGYRFNEYYPDWDYPGSCDTAVYEYTRNLQVGKGESERSYIKRVSVPRVVGNLWYQTVPRLSLRGEDSINIIHWSAIDAPLYRVRNRLFIMWDTSGVTSFPYELMLLGALSSEGICTDLRTVLIGQKSLRELVFTYVGNSRSYMAKYVEGIGLTYYKHISGDSDLEYILEYAVNCDLEYGRPVSINEQPTPVRHTVHTFPNPVSLRHGTLYVEYQMSGSQLGSQLTIFDGLGRRMGVYSASPGSGRIAINVSSFKPGMYFYRFEGKDVSIGKFVVVE